MPWVYDPHSGGIKIPNNVKEQTKDRILKHAEKFYDGKYERLNIRFRKQFCYIDAYVMPHIPDNFSPSDFSETREEYIERVSNFPLHLCRIRYFDEDKWSLAFYKYSNEKYEPCMFDNGSFHGTPEEAFDIGAVYLQD
ncbi:hypothetical protein QUF74_18670 [Candidatus Halobeggiatoa sp. HSG11]|nr:hypothetical protein [Candidatus Halobeggiatoa sp. HSG11]